MCPSADIPFPAQQLPHRADTDEIRNLNHGFRSILRWNPKFVKAFSHIAAGSYKFSHSSNTSLCHTEKN
jgi:hypothetical protein